MNSIIYIHPFWDFIHGKFRELEKKKKGELNRKIKWYQVKYLFDRYFDTKINKIEIGFVTLGPGKVEKTKREIKQQEI